MLLVCPTTGAEDGTAVVLVSGSVWNLSEAWYQPCSVQLCLVPLFLN